MRVSKPKDGVPPVAAAVAMGSFTVETSPDKADITVVWGAPLGNIQQANLGVSPTAAFSLPAGSNVTVKATKDAYEDEVAQLDVLANFEKKVFLKLAPSPTPSPSVPTPPPPPPPTRKGALTLHALTVENLEPTDIKVIITNDAGFTVVSRVIASGKSQKLAANIGRNFTYLIEIGGKGYMSNLSSDDVCVHKSVLPIQFPGAAARLEVLISDYVAV